MKTQDIKYKTFSPQIGDIEAAQAELTKLRADLKTAAESTKNKFKSEKKQI